MSLSWISRKKRRQIYSPARRRPRSQVRYAWTDYVQCALYNSDGLPAAPFSLTIPKSSSGEAVPTLRKVAQPNPIQSPPMGTLLGLALYPTFTACAGRFSLCLLLTLFPVCPSPFLPARIQQLESGDRMAYFAPLHTIHLRW
jgi:hypothetical protein